MPVAVGEGPFVVCPDLPMPRSFTTILGETFRLVDRDRGTGPIPIRDGTWSTGPAAVPLRSWEDPVVVDPTDGDPFDFSFREAHQWAMENVSDYRAIVEADGLVVSTWPKQGGSSSLTPSGPGPGATIENKSERELSALRPNGSGLEIELERTEYASPTRDPTFRVKNRERFQLDTYPTRASVRAKLAEADATYRLARQIGGKERTPAIPLLQTFNLRWNKWYLPIHDFGGSIRTDGYTIDHWAADEPPFPTEGGLALKTPHLFQVDGPTGTVITVEVNRTRLPIRQWV